MRIVGGNLALDFVNTRSGPPDGPPDDDILHRYDDVIAWARWIGLLTDTAAAQLHRQGQADAVAAQAAYRRALDVRDRLDELFRSVATGHTPTGRLLAAFRDDAAEALAHAEIRADNGGFRWHWADHRDLRQPLWPIVHAAATLLTTGPLDRLKGCAGCRFLFLDESKNRSRRWCSMEDCGTTAKIHRYVARRASARTRTVASRSAGAAPGGPHPDIDAAR
jgi:predicted RNA-binding Zn ribbon-like protein